MEDRYSEEVRRLGEAVWDGPGDSAPALRRAVAERAASFGGRATATAPEVPPALVAYVDTAPEICNDSRDNNCDGRIDYFDSSCMATNGTCAAAQSIPGEGLYYGTTVGEPNNIALGCNTGSYNESCSG